jgi:hypothetical protein
LIGAGLVTALSSALFFPSLVLGANNLDVVINELAWMGNTNSANDEWIELYNNTNESITLNDWVLKNSDEKLKINLEGTILSKGFYLLERTDDNAVPTITADLVYKGALRNEGESLKLYDSSGNLIDEINANSGWAAGNNATKQTMERISSGNWQTSQNVGGTPKAKNSADEKILAPPSPTPLQLSSPLSTSTPPAVPTIGSFLKTYPLGIIINEILPSPDGPDETEEWVEISNQNNFEVDLTGWQLCDFFGKTKKYAFADGTTIKALSFLALSRPETQIILNNSGDKLSLVRPDGAVADTISYEVAIRGQSLARFGSETAWTERVTPGEKNLESSQAKESIQKESQTDLLPLAEVSLIGDKNLDSNGSSALRVFALGLLTAIVFSVILVFVKGIVFKK